jgi:hypothetical protein
VQVAHYRKEGYLLLDQPVFAAARFAALQDCFEGLLREWLAKKMSRSPEHMDVPHFWEPRLFDWLLDDAVLDLVEPLIGPDIALWSSHFICKPAAVGKRVPWHEDSAYWQGRLEPMEVVTVWLAIDPSTPANGNMQVIPRTHHNGYSAYENVARAEEAVFGTEIRQDQFDAAQAVDCILQPNHCSLHDGRLIHGSAANQGVQRRCGYTMRYMPTTVKHTPRAGEPFEIYLARGKDRAGNRYGEPGKANRAWIDAHPDGQPAGH